MTGLPPLLTVDQARELLDELGWKRCRSAVYEDIRAGRLPCRRLGSSVRIPRDELLAALGLQSEGGLRLSNGTPTGLAAATTRQETLE